MQSPRKSLLKSTFSYIMKINGISVGTSLYQKKIKDTNVKKVKFGNGAFLYLV